MIKSTYDSWHIYTKQFMLELFILDLLHHYFLARVVLPRRFLVPHAWTCHHRNHPSLNLNHLRRVQRALGISLILHPNPQRFRFVFDSMSQNLSAILKAKHERLIMLWILKFVMFVNTRRLEMFKSVMPCMIYPYSNKFKLFSWVGCVKKKRKYETHQ